MDPNLVIDTIKRAEDGDGVIVRLYECHGARGAAGIKLDLPFKQATLCNILEEPLGKAKSREDGVEISYKPYQIVTIRLS
jgi:alpha-mannosidase